ncbi:hypothetical protein PLESTB_000149400 [Pleodorina starrii]|uniref:protein acetyllysine N-acetyltransferase n=1 Tax=Pleodorina starrii TaxID=330485 RepID=A0A9W6BB11_9CHLO|nr:hypothetical protein PLESTM_000448000 [Pleodorina starrii]GLC48797.1 hypothetical protein PLESTB_000149400 [Pleodorina starrii]GLC72536.1 hypothetical protein PLESTF_001261900 [Pleodorina starrii]
MSLGYADRLKNKRNLGGQLGAKEYHQSFDDIKEGVKSLAGWVSDAKRVFVFTGAGISTACGIPDFRGPNGIWTLRKKKLPIPADLTPFEYARPSFTHMAIAALVAAGKVPYVCSQNVDSLHLWSGVPRTQLAELHGNCFAERCTQCRTEYNRDFQMETVDFKPSGRRCCQPGCGGPLVDNILDWDTPLPEDELEEAVRQAEDADVALVLGTSLQIQPANEIPTLTRDEGGKMVIVNLQKTPKDRKASLIIRSRVDVVMALLLQELGTQVPPYIRTERLVVEHVLSEAARDGSADCGCGRVLTVRVRSQHGPDCPLPMVESLRISVAGEDCCGGDTGVSGRDASGSSSSSGRLDGDAGAWAPPRSDLLSSPSSGGFSHSFAGVPPGLRSVRCTLHVRLVKWADEDKRDVTLQHSVDLSELALASSRSAQDGGSAAVADGPAVKECDGPTSSSSSSGTVIHTFVSQEVTYDPAHIVSAFIANPPPVTLPEQPKKKRQKPESDAPAAVPTRASLRLAGAARKAQPVSETTSSGGGCDSDES